MCPATRRLRDSGHLARYFRFVKYCTDVFGLPLLPI
jgi:hypothetical protein